MIVDNNWFEFVFEKNNKLSEDKTYARVSVSEKKNKEVSKVLHLYVGRKLANQLGLQAESYVQIVGNQSYQVLISKADQGVKVCHNKQANVVSLSKTIKDSRFRVHKSPTIEVQHTMIPNKGLVIDCSSLKL